MSSRYFALFMTLLSCYPSPGFAVEETESRTMKSSVNRPTPQLRNIDEASWPHPTQGTLVVEFKDGSFLGEGTLILPHVLLAPARTVYNYEEREWAISLTYILPADAKYNPNKVDDTRCGVQVITFRNYIKTKDPKFDFALVRLDRMLVGDGRFCTLKCTEDNRDPSEALSSIYLPPLVFKEVSAWAVKWGALSCAFNLGNMFRHGLYNEPKNYPEALKYYRIAGKGGHKSAQICVGNMYKYGKGVEKNSQRAAYWYGLADGTICRDDDGKYVNGSTSTSSEALPEGIKLLSLAASKGDTEKQYLLGLEYLDEGPNAKIKRSNTALGIQWLYEAAIKSHSEALRKLEEMAKDGNKICQKYLGQMYLTGKGVPLDYKKAFDLFLLSAQQREANSMSFLAYMYKTGKGVPKNKDEAISWYEKAAELGDKHSQDELKKLKGQK